MIANATFPPVRILPAQASSPGLIQRGLTFAMGQVLDPGSFLNRLRDIANREPLALAIGFKFLLAKAPVGAVMGTVKPTGYKDLANRAIAGDSFAMTELSKQVDDNPLGVIPYITLVAEAGNIDAWECLWQAAKSEDEPVREMVEDFLRQTPLSQLVDKVRGDLDPNSSNAHRTMKILNMLFLMIGRPAALVELENWGNERAGVTLRDLAYQNHPGAREAYQRWLQKKDRRPDQTPILIESSPKKPRRDSTEIGIPTVQKRPKPKK